MIKRKEYEGTLELDQSFIQNVTINSLTSETSTHTVNYVCTELSRIFLNSVYETLTDAGYSDTIKNEDEYSITVLGFKFYILLISNNMNIASASSIGLQVYCTCRRGASYVNGTCQNITIGKPVNNKLQYTYNITVKGDSNLVLINVGGYDTYADNRHLFLIAKVKNLITQKEGILYSGVPLGYSTDECYLIDEGDSIYNFKNISWYNNPYIFPPPYVNGTGLNTNTKYVCEPQLIYYGSYMVYSMIRANTQIFAKGHYYKIGGDIYYCDNSYNAANTFLYKIG